MREIEAKPVELEMFRERIFEWSRFLESYMGSWKQNELHARPENVLVRTCFDRSMSQADQERAEANRDVSRAYIRLSQVNR